MKRLTLMSKSSTPMLHLTDNNASPPRTEDMRESRPGLTNSVREVEHGSFTPLVRSLSGGCGNAASTSLVPRRGEGGGERATVCACA